MMKVELQEWLVKEGQKLYGSILDRVRITEISERAFSQIEKDIKQSVRESMDGISAVLSEILD